MFDSTENKLPYKTKIAEWVLPAKERNRIGWLTKSQHAKLRTLSAASGVPIQVLIGMLIDFGLPHVTKEYLKLVKEERVRYLGEVIPPLYGKSRKK